MKVLAQEGERCPMEGAPRKYITDSTVVDVPNTSHYRRLVREGSLLLALEEKKAVKAAVQKKAVAAAKGDK